MHGSGSVDIYICLKDQVDLNPIKKTYSVVYEKLHMLTKTSKPLFPLSIKLETP